MLVARKPTIELTKCRLSPEFLSTWKLNQWKLNQWKAGQNSWDVIDISSDDYCGVETGCSQPENSNASDDDRDLQNINGCEESFPLCFPIMDSVDADSDDDSVVICDSENLEQRNVCDRSQNLERFKRQAR